MKLSKMLAGCLALAMVLAGCGTKAGQQAAPAIPSYENATHIVLSDNGITVVLDTVVTPELKAEGVEREIISKIQSMRKDAGFEVVDRIKVYYVTDDAEIKNAFDCGKNIKSVVLADQIIAGAGEGFTKDLDVNGATVTVTISKVEA